MDIDAIAAVSMQMHAAETENSVEIAMLKKAMEMEQLIAAQLLQQFAAMQPAPASFGHKMDLWA